jgi:lipid-binding SYLF domain-containing protein
MTHKSRLLAASILGLGLLAAPLAAPPAQAATAQQNLVDRARITLDDLRHDKEFGNATGLLQRARGVLIVPRLFKGGFFIGGEGGSGVLMTRTGAGHWSEPAFYDIGSASFGLQIGLEQSEMVMLIMSQKALNAVMQNQFKIGANAGLAIVTLGSSVGAATTSAVGADIVTWASSSGAYAGISLEGSIIKPNTGDDAAYYGRPVTTRQVLERGVTNPSASPLVSTLDAMG